MIGSLNLTIIKILIGLRYKSVENILIKKSLGDSQSKQIHVKRTIKKTQRCSYYSCKGEILLTIKYLTQPIAGRICQ